ncbi:MAG: FlgD immunoglobulin-like domain containing protein [bacterium]
MRHPLATPLLAIVISVFATSALADEIEIRDALEIADPSAPLRPIMLPEPAAIPEYDAFAARLEETLSGAWAVYAWNPFTATARRAFGEGVEWSERPIATEADAIANARRFVKTYPDLFGVSDPEALRPTRATHALGKWVVLFQQEIEHPDASGGRLPVEGAVANVVLTDDGRVCVFGSDAHANPVPSAIAIPPERAAAIAANSIVAAGSLAASAPRILRTSLLPIRIEESGQRRIEYRTVHRIEAERAPGDAYAIDVDATSGAILRRSALRRHATRYAGTVTADIETLSPCEGFTPDVPLGNIIIDIAGVGKDTTDAAGAFSIPAPGPGYANAVIELKGPGVTVRSNPYYEDGGTHVSLEVYGDEIGISYANNQNTEANNDLYYAWKRGGVWSVELVDIANDVGTWSSLAFDGAGWPHISYHDQTFGDLRYAVRAESGWQIEVVDQSGVVGRHTSLALTSAGEPAIAYYDVTNRALKFARKTAGAWSIETAHRIDAANSVGEYCSLALGADALPRIAYAHVATAGGTGSLRYAWKNGAAWSRETVDAPSGAQAGTHASLALDAAGNPHVSYYAASAGDLKYAERVGGAWTVEGVDLFNADAGHWSSIGVQSTGASVIAYYEPTTTSAKYAIRSGGAWFADLLDGANSSAGLYTSLDIAPDDGIIVAYHEDLNEGAVTGVIKVSSRPATSGPWEFERALSGAARFTPAVSTFAPAAVHIASTTPRSDERDAFYTTTSSRAFLAAIDPAFIPPLVTVNANSNRYVFGGTYTSDGNIWLRRRDYRSSPPGYSFSRARLAGIVAHEYGHHIGLNRGDYGFLGDLAMEEGNAVIFATHMTDRPSDDSDESCPDECPGPDCNCDNTLRWPDDISPDPYETLRILCGFHWDARQAIELQMGDAAAAETTLARAWHFGLKAFKHSGYTMIDQVFDYFVMDDDDGNLWNGTPRHAALCGAATAHGFACPPVAIPAYEWDTIDIVDSSLAGSGTALAFGPTGEPRLTYGRKPTNDMYYAVKSGASWVSEKVSGAAIGTSVAMDASDNPHFGYTRLVGNAREVRYATKTPTTWTNNLIESSPTLYAGNQMNIAREPDGTIHMAYSLHGTAWVPAEVHYARRNATAWTVETVGSGEGCSMHIDGAGTTRLAYVELSTQRLKYARKPALGAWTIETAASGLTQAPAAQFTSIAFDSTNGNVYVSYRTGNALGYARRTASAWTAEIVDSGAAKVVGNQNCIGLDPLGNPGISYHSTLDITQGDLKFATKSGGTWKVDFVERGGRVGAFTVLNYDALGRPMIACVDSSRSAVRFFVGAAVQAGAGGVRDGARGGESRSDPGAAAAADRATATPASPGAIAVSAWPNPAAGGARIVFQLPRGAPAQLAIYDVTGRRVRTLAIGPAADERSEATWNGADDGGRAVAPGYYFVDLTQGTHRATAKLLLVR